ncbi:MAG: hypothetical protein M3O41_00380 [Pseudomonadota bacterium]|nr:hypothetical protein [Pseudomonadota bacterium]
MQDEPLFKLPTRIEKLIATVEAEGWKVRTTWASYVDEDTPMMSVAMRCVRGTTAAYGIWLTENEGKSVKWMHGGLYDRGTLEPAPTLKRLTELLIPKDEDVIHDH